MLNKRTLKILIFGLAALLIVIGIFYSPLKRGSFNYFLMRGITNYDSNDLSAAEINFRIVKFVDSKDPRGWAWQGKVYMKTLQYELAEINLSRAVDLGIQEKSEKLYSEAIYNIAVANEFMERYEKAADFYQKFITLHPEQPIWSHYRLASIYFEKLYNFDKARNLTSILVKLAENPRVDKAAIYNLLGRIYFFDDDYDSAIKYFNKSLDFPYTIDGPREWLVNLGLASALARKGFLDNALKIIEKTRQSGPLIEYDCPVASAYLDVKNYQKAIELSKPVIDRGEKEPLCLGVLGKSYLAIGRRSEAKEVIQKFINFVEPLKYKSVTLHRRLREFKDILKTL
ncbi:MAG: tetratricopeptide repeat protein [Parcubacteria group bacterium]|nr:tetratricopeptide repeat protein [Parcubacteria group bacterium]